MFTLAGKLAVVTGAGSGIGAAVATRFARAGARIAALDVDLAAAEHVTAAIEAAGGTANAFACDVAERRQRARGVRGD